MDFNGLYRNMSTIHCPSFQFSEIDLSQLLYDILSGEYHMIGIIMSKLKNKLLHFNYIS